MATSAEDTQSLSEPTTERSRRINTFWNQEIFIPDLLPPRLIQQLGFGNLYFRNAMKQDAPDLYLGHIANATQTDDEPWTTALATAQVGILTSFAGINNQGRIIIAGYDMKNSGELLRLKISISYPESQEIIDAAEKDRVGVFDSLITTDSSGHSDHTSPVALGMSVGKDFTGLVRLVNLPGGARLGPLTPFGFSEKTPHDYGVELGFRADRTDTTVSLSYKDAFHVEIPRFLSN